jgi:hypothetical protein
MLIERLTDQNLDDRLLAHASSFAALSSLFEGFSFGWIERDP